MECYYFGTFNPVHIGHIQTAKEVLDEFNFSKIIFVPSFNPPHKTNYISPIDRLNMLKLIEKDKIKVSDIEFNLPAPSYSYRTIEALLGKEKKRLNFIIGYDAFIKIESWMNPEFLKKNLFFVVLKRKGEKREDIEKLKEKGFEFKIAEKVNLYDISSTKIREMVENEEDIKDLVDEKVKRYIYEHRLYRRNS